MPSESVPLFLWKGTVLPYVWKPMLTTFIATLLFCCIYETVRKERDRVKWQDKLIFHLFNDAEVFFEIATGFVTFILSFTHATVYGRWQDLRMKWTELESLSEDSSMVIAAYVNHDKDMRVKEKMLRNIEIAIALANQMVRGETTLKGVLDRGCLDRGSAEEKELLQMLGEGPCDCWPEMIAAVCGWCLKTVTETTKDGRMVEPGNFLYYMHGNLSRIRDTSKIISSYLHTQMPLGYTHLLKLMVIIHLASACIGLVPKLHWVAPPIASLCTLFFYGVFMLATHMSDPFHEATDFGFDTFKLLQVSHRRSRSLVKHISFRAYMPASHLGEVPSQS